MQHTPSTHHHFFFFFLMIRRPQRSPLFPYPTLSRSARLHNPPLRRALDEDAIGVPLRAEPSAVDAGPLAQVPVARVRFPRQRLVICDAREQEVGQRRSEEHTSELQSQSNLVCRLLLE